MKHWVITFGSDGSVETCKELSGPAGKDWVIVEAKDETDALKLALRMRAKRTRAANKSKGLCACGCVRDRKKPDGTLFLCCHRCHINHHRSNSLKRGITTEPRVKDVYPLRQFAGVKEPTNEQFSKDRLGVLQEVRRAWQRSANNQVFTKWLATEIERLTKDTAA